METEVGRYDEFAGKSFAQREPSKHNHSIDASATDAQSSASACFDCSICLDFAVDPVVTLCGHLFCWPCIYKWLQVETSSPHQCPVCKSPLSLNTLVPLYGRGSSNSANKVLNIPNRPAVLRDAIASMTDDDYENFRQPIQERPVHHHHHHYYYPSPWGGGMSLFSSTAGAVLAGLAVAILPLISRNNQTAEVQFSRSNQLPLEENSRSRRMQERRVEDSLHQLWVFLFCCAILGLLFF